MDWGDALFCGIAGLLAASVYLISVRLGCVPGAVEKARGVTRLLAIDRL